VILVNLSPGFLYLALEAGSRLRKQTARKTPQANEFARLKIIAIFGENFPSSLNSSVRRANSKRHLEKKLTKILFYLD
jgi:hypothetical protein